MCAAGLPCAQPPYVSPSRHTSGAPPGSGIGGDTADRPVAGCLPPYPEPARRAAEPALPRRGPGAAGRTRTRGADRTCAGVAGASGRAVPVTRDTGGAEGTAVPPPGWSAASAAAAGRARAGGPDGGGAGETVVQPAAAQAAIRTTTRGRRRTRPTLHEA